MTNQEQRHLLSTDELLLSVLQDKEKLYKIANTEIIRLKKCIVRFHQISCLCQISVTARLLYYYVLRRMTRAHGAPIFFSTDERIIEETGLNYEKLLKAREELIHLNLIIYNPGDYGISLKPMYKVEN